MKKLWAKSWPRGIDPGRLRLEWISATEGRTFQQVIRAMADRLRGKGEKGLKDRGETGKRGRERERQESTQL